MNTRVATRVRVTSMSPCVVHIHNFCACIVLLWSQPPWITQCDWLQRSAVHVLKFAHVQLGVLLWREWHLPISCLEYAELHMHELYHAELRALWSDGQPCPSLSGAVLSHTSGQFWRKPPTMVRVGYGQWRRLVSNFSSVHSLRCVTWCGPHQLYPLVTPPDEQNALRILYIISHTCFIT